MATSILYPSKFCEKCQCVTDRYRKGECKPCAKARTIIYRANNAEKIKASNAIYQAKNSDKIAESRAAWVENNLEKAKSSRVQWRLNNPEKMQQARDNWAKNNPNKKAEMKAVWLAKNPDATTRYNHNRRAAKLANGGTLTRGIVKKLLSKQKGLCPCCSMPLGDDYHVDHIIPIVLGGSNTDGNVQLLRAVCNLQKSTKHPIDYMQSKGFLL